MQIQLLPYVWKETDNIILFKEVNMKNKIDYILQRIQLYSYLLPTVKIGNSIMDFRKKYLINN